MCELNVSRPVGDSLVESAQFQCDFVLRNLLDRSNNLELLIRMNHGPLEVSLALKSVDLELVEVFVKREAFRHCLLLLAIFFIALFQLFFLN